MTLESLTATVALIGIVILVSSLLSGVVERTGIPQVAIFLLLGAVLGPFGLAVFDLGLDSPALRAIATLSGPPGSAQVARRRSVERAEV